MKDISFIINHLGEERGKYYNAMTPPIFQTSNFSFRNVKEIKKALADEKNNFLYSRGNNPTLDILCKKVAALEGTDEALAFASGMAAISAAILSSAGCGDHVICVRNCYSWTYFLLTKYLPRFGVEATFVDGRRAGNFTRAIRKNTKLIYLESPNSLTFEIQDIEEVARIAGSHGITTAIDNSYSSPLSQSPARMGVDLILHTASKYLGGHSDVVAGLVCGSSGKIKKIFENEYLGLGGIISPFNAWLIIRGLRTLQARMDRISITTQKVLEYLSGHRMVSEILHPLWPSHPQYALAKKQMMKPAGLFSVRLNTNSSQKIELFVNSLKQFVLGVSWGGHESLVFPAMAFDENRSKEGYPNNLVRFYIGLDEPESLINDLERAFRKVSRS